MTFFVMIFELWQGIILCFYIKIVDPWDWENNGLILKGRLMIPLYIL